MGDSQSKLEQAVFELKQYVQVRADSPGDIIRTGTETREVICRYCQEGVDGGSLGNILWTLLNLVSCLYPQDRY